VQSAGFNHRTKLEKIGWWIGSGQIHFLIIGALRRKEAGVTWGGRDCRKGLAGQNHKKRCSAENAVGLGGEDRGGRGGSHAMPVGSQVVAGRGLGKQRKDSKGTVGA